MPDTSPAPPRPSRDEEIRVLDAFRRAYARGNRTVLVQVTTPRADPAARHVHVAPLAPDREVA